MELKAKERLLVMLTLLVQKVRRYSVRQMAEELGVDRRTVYRYIDALNAAGFIVHTDHRHIRLEEATQVGKQLSDLLYFNHEEATTLFHAIDSIETNTAQRAELKRKLASLYGSRTVAEKVMRVEHERVAQRIKEAIEGRQRALFVGYSSPSSNTRSDRLVEPFQFSDDGESVWAYEVQTMQNKIFRLSRIQEVRVEGGCWLQSRRHQAGYTDAFRMISFDGKTTPVRLRLSRRAYNLLLEEYPNAEQDVTYDAVREEWIYETRVSNMKGIGRFVMGLSDCITVESPELRSYLLHFARQHVMEKYSL